MARETPKTKLTSQISLLAQAMQCDNEDAATLLVKRALQVIFGEPNSYSNRPRWTKQEEREVISLIRGIQPKDAVEAILAAQHVALSLHGMSLIENDDTRGMAQGLVMIKLSHQALDTLQRYRGKNKNVNVNYNVTNQGDAILNTLVQTTNKLQSKE